VTHKRRGTLFTLYFAATTLSVASAFLPWFDGRLPQTLDASEILLPLGFFANSWQLSAVFLLFIAAFFWFLAALFANKFLGVFASLLSISLALLWYFASNFSSSPSFGFAQVGLGTCFFTGAILLSIVAIFIPKKRSRPRKSRDNEDWSIYEKFSQIAVRKIFTKPKIRHSARIYSSQNLETSHERNDFRISDLEIGN